eukprot:TRINITY_DN3086_c0_g6_i1.p1 TRINITY_DN3086_c0_g6~~TRINITY_DN3086_c0_g6_i1.p1  ORF type:complete len:537 (-),score=97.08 TRINITY_DN3086_c0_g6_i1:193-1803(-)
MAAAKECLRLLDAELDALHSEYDRLESENQLFRKWLGLPTEKSMPSDVDACTLLGLAHLAPGKRNRSCITQQPMLKDSSVPEPPEDVPEPIEVYHGVSEQTKIYNSSVQSEGLEACSPRAAVAKRFSDYVYGKKDCDEPPLVKFIQSSKFEMIVGCLILANSIVMAFESQYHGMQAGFIAGVPGFIKPAREEWPGAVDVFLVFEYIFTLIFSVELLFRLIVLKKKLFMIPLNWIDIFAVVVSWMALSGADTKMNPMVARLVRLAKLGRGLRLAKAARVLQALQFLLKCIQASVITLSWSIVLLILVQCIAGMIISQMVRTFIMDPNQDIEARHEVFRYYGSFTLTMITMFEVHFANYAPACRILVRHLGEGYAFVFIMYRCLIGFAVLNVINAVFIQHTMQVAQQDSEVVMLLIEKEAKRREKHTRELQQWFQAIDVDGSGTLSLDELQSALSEPSMRVWMRHLEIDAADISSLFEIIDVDKSGEISFDALVQGAQKVRGAAKHIDLVCLLTQVRKLDEKMEMLAESMGGCALSKS